jgi:pumilio family protein 6
MTIGLQKILEKGTVEYSIVHTAILEYFTIADKVIVVCCVLHMFRLTVHFWELVLQFIRL